LEPRAVDRVPAGTLVADVPPDGWTHLVVKSMPRVASGDVDALSDKTSWLASFLFSTILAEVAEDRALEGPPRFVLKRIAAGVGMRIGRRDVVITTDTQEKLGANLGLLARQVLSETEERLGDTRVVARSDTFALVDARVTMLRDEKHRKVVLRYALLVDPTTGGLAALLWPIDLDKDGKLLDAAGPIEVLPQNKREDCRLHVDKSEFTLGLPTEEAFAIENPPAGRVAVNMPETLLPEAVAPVLKADGFARLERSLRSLYSWVVKQEQNVQAEQARRPARPRQGGNPR
jgi:hypothetical protein